MLPAKRALPPSSAPFSILSATLPVHRTFHPLCHTARPMHLSPSLPGCCLTFMYIHDAPPSPCKQQVYAGRARRTFSK
eukprot:363431-Chlamydomonas_euryale.AAC.7